MDKNKVVVGLSGGVDSAVTAYLLKEKGFTVIGATMKQFEKEEFSKDAQAVSEYLGIEHRIVDMSEIFKKDIIDYFVSSYKEGRTPNPCVFCNPKVKWRTMLSVADSVGAMYVATGHYARIDEINGRYSIKNSVTAKKDQTYALCYLTQEMLKRTLTPLGDYSKEEIREIAKKAGLPVAGKADSQDICFILDKDYGKFLEEYTGDKFSPGNFVDKNGNVLGKHEGIVNYTIGQRKGLNLAMGHPVFVTGIDTSRNEVVIGENEDLFTTDFSCTDMNFMCGTKEMLPKKLVCKIRYAHKGTEALLSFDGEKYNVKFDEPVRAITPGQTAVFYDGEYVFSGGTIQ